jgi:hypothetical protein
MEHDPGYQLVFIWNECPHLAPLIGLYYKIKINVHPLIRNDGRIKYWKKS